VFQIKFKEDQILKERRVKVKIIRIRKGEEVVENNIKIKNKHKRKNLKKKNIPKMKKSIKWSQLYNSNNN